MMPELSPLGPHDAEEYHRLLQRNADHLGPDYAEDLGLGVGEHAARFAVNPEPALMFGIRLDGGLVGRIDLVAVEPPRYGLGYWLSETVTGRGYGTWAVKATVAYAARRLRATDVFAGVTHGNVRSVAVLERVGFAKVADFATYTRFHLELTPVS